MTDEHHSDSQLGQSCGILLGGRRGHTRQTACPWADPAQGDQYAPAPCRCKCKSRTGYRRRQHEYLHESPKGTRCIFCGVLLGAERFPRV